MNEKTEEMKKLVNDAKRVVIVQADNPDADSLASALTLELILHELGKEPYLYCGVDMPEYLKYLSGWDRVEKTIPTQFDLSIIVDTSALVLLEKLTQSEIKGWIASRPCLVLDHHAGVDCDIPFATLVINDSSKVSTGEVIYDIAKALGWPLPVAAQELIMTSILSDSLGLTTENTTKDTYMVMSELVAAGVNRPKLEELRRAATKMPTVIFGYKAKLIERTEFHAGGRLAVVAIPQADITAFSPLYNPNALIQNEHLQTQDVLVSVSMKVYDTGRITASIRCNSGAPIAAKLAEKFDGGGHAYAAGFKLEGKLFETVKKDCIDSAEILLNDIVEN